MLQLEATIIACAVATQLASAVLALRLIGLTRRSLAWVSIAAAITLMALRRLESLVTLLSGEAVPDLLFEVNGLAISVLMLVGMWLIRPIFVALARSEGQQREMASRLAALSQGQEALIADLRKALGSIKTLKGMLPICASCKKVRDDEGYWRQIEAYLTEHSEAEFTHGICPECYRKLYPEPGREGGER